MNCVLFDDDSRQDLLPLTFTRPVADLRVGIFTIREKWNSHLNTHCSILTENYLQPKFGFKASDDTLFINGCLLPDENLLPALQKLEKNQALFSKDLLLAIRADSREISTYKDFTIDKKINYELEYYSVRFPWQLFLVNSHAIKSDFEIVKKNKKSRPLPTSNTLTAGSASDIFIEDGARVEGCTINTSQGPVYIGKNAEIMEGCLIRGPLALGEEAVIKMGAKIYGATTIGPHCKVGGEVSNSVFSGYSNKAHDGFIGNSVIGEWCNLGADTNNSNLKNNYGDVKMYSYRQKEEMPTGLQFCGVVMGDHSKTGINTMLNTGTVIGVSANIFGSGFPPKYIPSFIWGGAEGFVEFQLDKAMEVAQRMYERRSMKFDGAEKAIFEKLFSMKEQF